MLFGKHINRYYLRFAPVLLLGLLALVMVDLSQLRIPELYRMVVNGLNGLPNEVDGVSYAFDVDFLLRFICKPLLLVILVMVIGRFVWRICFLSSAVRLETDLRGRMFSRAKLLSHQYYQVNKVGTLMSLFTNDIDTVQDCFGWGILMFFDTVVLGTLAIVKMGRMNLFLTLFALIPILFLLGASTCLDRFMSRKWEIRQAAFSHLSDFAQESFSGIAVVKAFVKEARELHSFRKLNVENEDANVDFTRLSVLFDIFITLFIESVVCIILGYGGFLVYRGIFTGGELVEFLGYFTSVIWPIMAISELIRMHSEGKASLRRIGELLEAPVDVKDRPDVTDIPPITGEIEFRHLTFRYPDGDSDVLRDVSFHIQPGENVGIIGRTGSGKTTVVDLILRTYNVPDGTLFIDGHDVNTFPIATLRRYAAYVPQDNFLFSDTVENNIAFAVDEVDEEQVRRVARLSDIDGNIRGFTDGYRTLLGERGVTVSGGQKQRISIARALMKEAPILILDDSVSAVDTATERTILSNLRQNRRGKTTVLIAHRISTVEQMDKIVFVEEGRVTDVGTHDELYARCPAYRTMVELQRLEDVSTEGGEAHA